MVKGKRKTEKMAPLHPGEVLREEYMRPLKLSANRLALELRVPPTRVVAIVREERGITADTALRLARYFGTSPELWLGLQIDYDLDIALDQKGERIERDVHPREAA